MPIDYDSEEEQIKIRKAKDRADKDEDWRSVNRGKENVDLNEDVDAWRRPRVYMAGFAPLPREPNDIGEEARSLARTFRRCSRRLERWQESNLPGQAIIRGRQLQAQGRLNPKRRGMLFKEPSMERDDLELYQDQSRVNARRRRSGIGRGNSHRLVSEGLKEDHKMDIEPDDEDGGGELDEEDRELLGEVDADESEEDDEDEVMDDD